jgi:hypothetical protein
MGKKKIIIDTNNFISNIGWKGNSRDLVQKVIDKEYELYISHKQIVELKKVMNYSKLGFTESQKQSFLELLTNIATIVNTKIIFNVTEDPDDNMFLECAFEVKADYIISGDEHLKKLKEFKGTKIVSVKEFLDENK